MQVPEYSVAVLDDHSLIIDAICSMIGGNNSYRWAGGFASAGDFYAVLESGRVPDFLLLDINLNGEDGLKICQDIHRKFPALKIIMLTGLSEPAIVKTAVKSGCAGFMLKNMRAEELWECLQKAASGQLYLHKDIEKVMVSNTLGMRSGTGNYIPRLSKREKEVLDLIVREMTTQEIAAELFISVNTVETHRASLLSKLGARNIAGLVKAAMEKGLV